MISEWKRTTLADVSSDISYGYTESATSEKIGPRFLRITDIQNGIVDWRTVPYCPISDSNHAKYLLEKGDIVVARTGNSTGENYIFDSEEEAIFASYLIRFKIAPEKANPHFVWYSMRSPSWWAFVNTSKTGSAQAGANAKVLGRFVLHLPPITEQQRIANILGTLDDKIELNRQMNDTLEAMAQALFQSWFVDFDPVIDKALASGKEIPEPLQEKAARREALGIQRKRLPPEIENLFPDEFIESELGWIPKGWDSKLLGNILTPKKGKTITKEKCIEGTIPVIAGGLKPAYYHNQHNVSSPAVTISASGANAGYVSLHYRNIWASDCSFIGYEQTSTPYLWYIFLKINQKRIFEMQHGAAQPHIYPADVMRLPTVHPNNRILWEQANQLLTPLFLQIGRNLSDSEILINLRDTLLPKLISGEVRVPEAEAALAGVFHE